MKYNFDLMLDRTEVPTSKWSKELWQKNYSEQEMLPISVADMDFEVAPAISKAVQERAAHPIYGYCYPSEEYIQSIVNWQKRRHHWDIKPEWISYMPTLNMALLCVVEAYTKPGDKVIVQSPVYYPYFEYVEKTGRSVITNQLKNNDGYYTIDFDDLESCAKDPDTKLLLLCNPHNPIGRVWTKDELAKIGEICIKNNVIVVVDEIFADLILPSHTFTSFAAISDEFADISVVCSSPTKAFNIGGLMTAQVIVPNDQLREILESKMGPYYMWPGDFGTVAQIAAYNDSEEWLDELTIYLGENAKFIKEFLDSHLPKVKYWVPEGTYLAWLDFSAYHLTNEQLTDLMYHHAKVIMDNGKAYSQNGETDSYQRFNFACSKARVEEALKRIESALNTIDVK